MFHPSFSDSAHDPVVGQASRLFSTCLHQKHDRRDALSYQAHSRNPTTSHFDACSAARPAMLHISNAVSLTLMAFVLALDSLANVAQDAKSLTTVSFTNDIAPVLIKKCLTCHGPEKAKGGYQLHTFELMLKAGDSESSPITAGEPDESELQRRLTTADPDDRMPQKDDTLPAAQIALFARWIKEGARFDGNDPKAPLVSLVPRASHPEPPASYRFPMPVTAVAFNLDAQELAVGGYHEITIWSPTEGKLLRRIKNVAQRTQALAYQPKGSLLAAVGGAPGEAGEAALFDPVSGSLVKLLGTMSDVMLAACFSPDGSRLAAGGGDNSIHIFDIATGKEQLLIQQHADWVMALAFDGDGTHIASASRDRTARIYNSKTGELETTYNDHNTAVFGVALGSDGKRAYSAGRDRKIHLWEAKDGKKSGEIGGFDDDVVRLFFKKDNLFSCSTDKLIRQHAMPDRKLVRTYSGHKDWVHALDYHPGANRLASGSHDGEVRIWNTEDGTLLKTFVAAPGYVTAQNSK
ncbi:MAG: hypothetical protein FJ403_17320 [Verrucomicrobia bacterium]|nr:hypothetical protein [Verrucomicrobiota bacterium]